MRRNPRWTWAGIVIYATAVTLPHENVQMFVGRLANWMGRRHLYELAGGLGIAGAIALTLVVIKTLRDQQQRRILVAFWLITLALIVATWKMLTANNTELIHYPQYIPEGMTILALTLSPAESLAWVAIFGGIDECFQYWGLHGGWGIPYDFNDVYMDLLGGSMGVLLGIIFLGSRRRESPGALLRRPGILAAGAIVAISAILLATGKMLLYKDPAKSYWIALSRLKPNGFWFFDPTWGPHTFHALLPLEGPALILLTIALFAILDRRLEIFSK